MHILARTFTTDTVESKGGPGGKQRPNVRLTD